MRTLYVTEHFARLRVKKANLVVEQGRATHRVPIETLEAVVLTGRAEISNEAMGELVRRGVRVAAISKSGRLRFWVSGPTKGNVLLRLAQYEQSTARNAALGLAKLFVAGKLQNCRRMMLRWAWDARGRIERQLIESDADTVAARLAALPGALDGDTVRGIEGDGTRRYFRSMAVHLGEADRTLSFERRSRRPPRDPTNALLSFTYGLVLTEVVGALEAVGLDPQVGFLHCARPGRPSLALDLLEEFRPSLADRFVVAALRRGQLTAEDLEARAGRAVYLTADGKRRLLSLYDEYRQREVIHPLLDRAVPIALLPSIQATLLARYLRGDLPVYPPYTMAA
jgi:CRISPR-associated protein Cas1